MKQLQVGETTKRRPVWATGPGLVRHTTKKRDCTVVWVHPKGRYHMVRYDFPGGSVYECFAGVVE